MKKSHYATLARVENKHWWFISKRALINKFIPKSAKQILDVGAGTGTLVENLQKKGFQVQGIEPSPEGLTYAFRHNLPVSRGFVERISFRDNSFDCVTCVDVLYHKDVDVDAAVPEMLRVLKPGGTLIIFDCAYNWMRGPHDEEVMARERFNREKLVKLVENLGAIVSYSSYFYFLLFPIILVSRMLQKYLKLYKTIQTPNTLLNKTLILIVKIELLFMNLVSYPWGSSIIVVAQKQMR